jgi:hypothetical protein
MIELILNLSNARPSIIHRVSLFKTTTPNAKFFNIVIMILGSQVYEYIDIQR